MNGELERQAKEKAREYFRTKATPLPVSEVRARIAEPLRACDELLTPLSAGQAARATIPGEWTVHEIVDHLVETYRPGLDELWCLLAGCRPPGEPIPDRKSTRLNSSHRCISYAVFCLKKKMPNGPRPPVSPHNCMPERSTSPTWP